MAQCVDLRREHAAASDRFLLDTNVVVLVASLYGSPSGEPYQIFIQRALGAGATFFVSLLTLFELAHVVERKSFQRSGGRGDDARALKRFRADAVQRAGVVRDVRATWGEIVEFATVLPIDVPAASDAGFVATLGATTLDAYDVALVDQAKRAKISTIVTDDGDFASASGIIVFTANARALA